MRVIIEKTGPVTTLIINRAEVRNAVDRPTAEALGAALRAFEADEQARVAVLTGAGGTFCAGADLGAVAEGVERSNRLDTEGDGPMGPSRMQLSKPLIAAIEGHAVAGGLELALLADLRVMADNAVLGVFCRRFGVPLIDGGTVRLPRIIGQGRALDLILTGRPVLAEEALSMAWSTGWSQPVARWLQRSNWRWRLPASHNAACSPTAPALMRSGTCRLPRPSPMSLSVAWR